ncbi:hypothetical protein [Lactobacillus helveticus]|uniref:hypothetical protein n=1 Tax=Lactobacillus helveticus TaxID=1587 RepID=UPI000A9DA2F4|nr:hypothetical protein [Lactobacillus helveticus]
MKRKLILFLTACSIIFSVALINQRKASAASWDAKSLYTTPKQTRGTWYYKKNGKIKKLRITAHTFDKVKLYKMLSNKQTRKWTKKLAKADQESGFKLAKKLVHLNMRLMILNFISQLALLLMVGFPVIMLIRVILMLLLRKNIRVVKLKLYA